MIMAEIEPELMTDSLPNLAAKYVSETKEEERARTERYNKAFALYAEQFQAYQEEWQQQWSHYKRQAVSSIEHAAYAEESHDLERLESQFSAA